MQCKQPDQYSKQIKPHQTKTNTSRKKNRNKQILYELLTVSQWNIKSAKGTGLNVSKKANKKMWSEQANKQTKNITWATDREAKNVIYGNWLGVSSTAWRTSTHRTHKFLLDFMPPTWWLWSFHVEFQILTFYLLKQTNFTTEQISVCCFVNHLTSAGLTGTHEK